MNDYFQKWCCLIIFNPEQINSDHLHAITSSINCTKHLYYEKEIIGSGILKKNNVIVVKHKVLGFVGFTAFLLCANANVGRVSNK